MHAFQLQNVVSFDAVEVLFASDTYEMIALMESYVEFDRIWNWVSKCSGNMLSSSNTGECAFEGYHEYSSIEIIPCLYANSFKVNDMTTWKNIIVLFHLSFSHKLPIAVFVFECFILTQNWKSISLFILAINLLD